MLKSCFRNKPLSQAGDTLVEVMLAMAIIGLVLGGAYATASRSLRIGRQAQERGEALKQVEGQIEKIKYLAPDPNAKIFDTTTGPVSTFCIQDVISNPATAKRSINNITDYANYPPECKKQTIYNISVTYDSTKDDLFIVSAVWDRLGGGQDEVTIRYRLHE